jgi:hypothetical protein
MNSDANAEFGLALHIKGYVWLGFLRTDALWCCSADSCVAKAVLGKAGALR